MALVSGLSRVFSWLSPLTMPTIARESPLLTKARCLVPRKSRGSGCRASRAAAADAVVVALALTVAALLLPMLLALLVEVTVEGSQQRMQQQQQARRQKERERGNSKERVGNAT